MKTIKFGLVAAAVLASLAVPAMAADVTIYGRAHLSVDSLDNGVDSGTNVSSNSSRLGFRAKTEIDGGLEAFVQVEQNGTTWWQPVNVDIRFPLETKWVNKKLQIQSKSSNPINGKLTVNGLNKPFSIQKNQNSLKYDFEFSVLKI